MARTSRNFLSRTVSERTWILENTWCEHCNLPDLGVEHPIEYEEDGEVYMEGACPVCHQRICCEIVDQRKVDSESQASR